MERGGPGALGAALVVGNGFRQVLVKVGRTETRGLLTPSRIARVSEQTIVTQSVSPGEGCVILRDPKSDCLTFLEPGLTSASRPPPRQ